MRQAQAIQLFDLDGTMTKEFNAKEDDLNKAIG